MLWLVRLLANGKCLPRFGSDGAVQEAGKTTIGSGRGLRMHSGIGRADIGASGGVTRSTVAGGVWKPSPPGTSPSS